MLGKKSATENWRTTPFNPQNVSYWFKDGDFRNHIVNENNIPITKDFIEELFKKYNFSHKVKHLENFQLAMVHISYVSRSSLTEKTANLLKDVIPIDDINKQRAMPLKDSDYDRYEYMGDSIVHCVLAEYLFNRYITEGSGFLTTLRSRLEKAETLSFLSKKLGLHKYAIVARNIEQSNGRENNTHLAEDIFEAFIGALSIEATYDECKKFLINIIETEIDMAELINNNDNYKDRLMQAFHRLKWGDPKYNEDVSRQKNIKEGCQEIRSFTSYVKIQLGMLLELE
jgi:dsRNA-specific ribonuclease